MMDAKYLAEIKAREQATTKGPWKVGDGDEKSWFCGPEAVVSTLRVVTGRAVYGDDSEFDSQTYRDIVFTAHARTDIPALLAEVERLTERNSALESDKINAEMNLENLSAEVEGLNAENATLKKALELALTDLDYHTGYSERENIIIRREAINRYIRQAQEQEAKCEEPL